MDCFWVDIDYMVAYRLFTLDVERYPDMRQVIDDLHKADQHIVVTVDPGIKTGDYEPYTFGKQLDIFLKRPSGSEFRGKVWPGHVVFPDWFHPKTQEYWTTCLRKWMTTLMPIDGVWHDMNECSNFLNGDVCDQTDPNALIDDILIPTDEETVEQLAAWSAEGGSEATETVAKRGAAKEKPKQAFDPCKPFSITNPPYSVNHGGQNWPLDARSISVDSVHHGGITEFNSHNLYGAQNCKTTFNSLLEIYPERRPFILTRSCSAGSGNYTSKWLGDNWSTWEALRHSVAGIFNFQMYGVLQVGCDIGGFNGVPSTELLIRWLELAALAYPFCRNHNLPNIPSQEVTSKPEVAKVGRKYLGLRYRLLPFWYTAAAKAHHTGGTLVAPPWTVFRYPLDQESHIITSCESILVDRSFLVLPVLQEGCYNNYELDTRRIMV